MNMANDDSLAATLDAVNEACFYGKPLPGHQREQTANWIANRQGKPGSYASMFAPTESDFKKGAKLFTGEMVTSRVGTSHILGEEACRALILLDAPIVNDALNQASRGMISRLDTTSQHESGMYCCGKCSVALWRHLAVGGLEDSERRLTAGLRALKSHRDGNGRWRTFPFYYTLLALSETDLPLAVEEIRYASSVCQRYLKRLPKDDEITQRRRAVVERVLEKC